MRALVCEEYGPPESLALEQRHDPVPAKGQLAIQIKAAGVNFPDLLIIAGKYQVKTPPPFIPGNEAAGVVTALGEGASRFEVGDPVIATPPGGAFAEQVAVDEQLAYPLPGALSFEQGAGFTITYATGYHALRQSTRLEPGETVLVLGAAGGAGIAAVEIAKALGARVIAAASSAEKLQFARDGGADELIDYSRQPLKETVKELTGGEGADVVYDPVGGELGGQALRALAWHGRYLIIGFACGEIPNFPANLALLKEASIIGVWWGTWAKRNPEQSGHNLRELAALVESGKINPRVTESYPLERYRDAFAAIAERRARGKVVLTM